MNQVVCRSILALLFLMTLQTISAQQVTLSNNLLYDAWLTPNLDWESAPVSIGRWA